MDNKPKLTFRGRFGGLRKVAGPDIVNKPYRGIDLSINHKEDEKQHHTPHIHARHGGQDVSIAIETSEVLAGEMHPTPLKYSKKWLKGHRADSQQIWDTEYFDIIKRKENEEKAARLAKRMKG